MIMKFLHNLKSRYTMKLTGNSFMDIVSWDVVQYWKDCYGDRWMAVNKWGFRSKCENNDRIE